MGHPLNILIAIKREIEKYYKQLFANVFNKSNEMDKLHKKDKLLKAYLIRNNLNSPMPIKEIKFLVKLFYKENSRPRRLSW